MRLWCSGRASASFSGSSLSQVGTLPRTPPSASCTRLVMCFIPQAIQSVFRENHFPIICISKEDFSSSSYTTDNHVMPNQVPDVEDMHRGVRVLSRSLRLPVVQALGQALHESQIGCL